ncbi:unnamed protein product [Paramecium sonneborni]|uniref:Uncharacterized protein n=1 Tax=Paramecium sonneborni TaxID=65129 RepID=A0A8S1LU82_9CILI|nr:unnamed protein product [Paramecium sonneborni]
MSGVRELDKQILETIFQQFKIMQEDFILGLQNNRKMLEQEIEMFKKKINQIYERQQLAEKIKEHRKENHLNNFTYVNSGSGCMDQSFNLNKKTKNQDQKILNEDDKFKQIQINLETEKKKRIFNDEQTTPAKKLDKQQNKQSQVQKQDSTKEKQNNINSEQQNQILLNYQQQKISGGQQFQNQELNFESNKNFQQINLQKVLCNHLHQINDHGKIENELIEFKKKYQLLEDQMKKLQKENKEKDQIIFHFTQQKNVNFSNDTTMTIEKIEEIPYNQVEQQIKKTLQDQLNEERRKNQQLIQNYQNFLQRLQHTFRLQRKQNDQIKQMEDEAIENQLLKEAKQVIEEISEYEENDRIQRQSIENQENKYKNLESKYEEISQYYAQAYNKLEEALRQIETLEQTIQDLNDKIEQSTNQIAQLQQNTPEQEKNEIDIQQNSQIIEEI